MIEKLKRTFKKTRQRRLLVISAGNGSGGIQGIFIGIGKDSWDILSSAYVPYPPKVASLIENSIRIPMHITDLGWLDYKISMLYLECAQATLGQVPRALKKPHLAVLNQLNLWKGSLPEKGQYSSWNITLGDSQLLASSLSVPVMSDFIRHHVLSGGSGSQPSTIGILRIAKKCPPLAAFINIGLISRLTIIDTIASKVLLDSSTGPGTCLINRCAFEMSCPDGFDRDGSQSAKGEVNVPALELLSGAPWFSQEAPKECSPDFFDSLLAEPCLGSLSPHDKLATITALTACTLYEFFRRYNKDNPQPEIIYISGGGANNLSLVKFLSTYFGHIPIKSVEELGIPVEMRVPLTLGLSIDAYLSGNPITWENSLHLPIPPFGRFTQP